MVALASVPGRHALVFQGPGSVTERSSAGAALLLVSHKLVS
jgi:hypothetical protein